MDRSSDEYYHGLEERLGSLSPQIRALVSSELADWYEEYVAVGEYGLAIEVISEVLTPDMPADVTQPLGEGLLSEAELMGLTGATVSRLRALARERP